MPKIPFDCQWHLLNIVEHFPQDTHIPSVIFCLLCLLTITMESEMLELHFIHALYSIPWCTGLLTFKSFPHSSTEIRIRLPRSIPQPRSRVRVAHEPSSRRRFRFSPHSSFTFCSVTAPPQQSLCPRALTVTLVSRPNYQIPLYSHSLCRLWEFHFVSRGFCPRSDVQVRCLYILVYYQFVMDRRRASQSIQFQCDS